MPKKKTPSRRPKKQRTRQAIGKQARAAGHSFERENVHLFRGHFSLEPWAENVRRSDQSHRAWLPDVTGVPGVWVECEKAGRPDPAKKLAQAIRDTRRHRKRGLSVIPVAFTVQKGTQRYQATMRAGDLAALLMNLDKTDENREERHFLANIPVTMTRAEFVSLLAVIRPWDSSNALDTHALEESFRGELPESVRTGKAVPDKTPRVKTEPDSAPKRLPRRAPRPENGRP